MMADLSSSQRLTPQHVWLLLVTYVVVLLLSNWFDARLVRLGTVVTDAGTLLFPFSFLLSGMITEVYGYQYTRRAIGCGFLFNLFFLLYGLIIIHLPGPAFSSLNHGFDELMRLNSRIIAASFLSYFCSEPLNAWWVAAMKIRWQGRNMGLRFVLSTCAAAGVDSIVFTWVAFLGVFAAPHLLSLCLTMWLIKVMIEFFGLPLSLYAVRRLKQLERLDVFDERTAFSVLSFKVNYSQQDNRFGYSTTR